MTQRTLLIVNFRSAALTRAAIASARQSSQEALEVIVVDNSVDDQEWEKLQSSGADRLIRSDSNLGYAGGINLGVRTASGDVIVVSNPDVTFAPATIDVLASTAVGMDGVAGPRFSWDIGGLWLLPPADLPTATSKIADLVASRSQSLRQRKSAQRFRRRVAFWQLERPTRVRALSGAVLAIPRSLLSRVGPFDERFRLYFEETDYLRRVRQHGRPVIYTPEARCRHAYNQSAGSEAGARNWYAESEAAYFRKWYGRRFDRALHVAAAPPPDLASFRETDAPRMRIERPLHDVVVEVSPLADFDVAVGFFPQFEEVVLPSEVVDDYRDADLYLRVVERRSAAVLEALHWRKR